MGVFIVQISPVFWGSGYLKHEGLGEQELAARNIANVGGGISIYLLKSSPPLPQLPPRLHERLDMFRFGWPAVSA